MKHASLVRLAGALAFAAFTLSGPVAQGHSCDRHADTNHKHCGGGGPSNLGDVIPGTAKINAVVILYDKIAISSDGKGTYQDGDPTRNVLNQPASMQVAMNCKANHFNLNPGGGPAPFGRRIHVDFVAGAGVEDGTITTAIDSCDIPNTSDDTVIVTDTLMTTPTCSTNAPYWGFDQVLRATPIAGEKNVCELVAGESSTASARFQTNLRHLDGCKGGKGKCGIHGEGIDLNWDGVSSSLKIACVIADGNGCTIWKITSTGFPILEQESQSGGVVGNFPIDIDFDAD